MSLACLNRETWVLLRELGKGVRAERVNLEDDDPLEDPNEWEHRIIRNVVWSRRKGYVVETALHGDPDDQSIEHYEINDCLLQMIRVCPHNMKRMASQMNNDDDNDDGNQDGTNDEIDRSWGPVHQV